MLRFERVTGEVVDAAMKVHTALGPGLLESAYQARMVVELRQRELDVAQQVALPVLFEVEAVTAVTSVHRAQLLSYLRLSGKRFGLLLNFHVVHMREGIMRMVNGH